jgi:hypothetical protein
MSSYHTELGGILATLYIIHGTCKYYDITNGKAKLYCDSKVAIVNCFTTITPGISPFFSPDYDLILLEKQIVAILPIPDFGEWVKGHYSGKDRKIQHDLNDKADKLAGKHLDAQSNQNGTNTSSIPSPGYGVRLLLYDCVLTSKYYSALSWA